MNPYDRVKKIDDYLENNMSYEEKKEFEELLLDPTASLGGSMKLRDEIKMQKAVIKGIQHMALRDVLEEENKKYRMWKKIGKSTLISSPLASVAVAAVVLVMFILSPAKDYIKNASVNYAKEYNISEMRGNLALDAAISAVASNRWDSASIYLKEVRRNLPYNPDGLTGNLYDDWFEYHWLKALCEMHNGHVIKTKYHLQRIINEIETDLENDNDPILVKAKELKEKIESKQRKLIRN